MKTFVIVGMDGRTRETFKGTQEQADLFWSTQYDTDRTDLKEQQPDDLNDIQIEDLGSNYAAKLNGKTLFEFNQVEDGTFILQDEAGEQIDIIPAKLLMSIPNFYRLVVCSACGNRGLHNNAPAPDTKLELCECEEVIFNID